MQAHVTIFSSILKNIRIITTIILQNIKLTYTFEQIKNNIISIIISVFQSKHFIMLKLYVHFLYIEEVNSKERRNFIII